MVEEEESATSWEHGEGRTGILKVAELKTSGRCLAIGWSFPWWGLVSGRLGLALAKLIIFNPSLLRLTQDYFPDVNVRVAGGYEDVLEEELLGVRVLCLERPPKDKKALGVLLGKGKELERVVFSGGKRTGICGLPKGWMLDELDVKHAAVGGVTDAIGKFVILRRSKSGHTGGGKLVVTPRPARDAREILKMARPGIKSTGLNNLPFTAVKSTEFVEAGVMSCAGIIPFPKGRKSFRHFAPRVLTKYGGRIWIKRKFEAKELLAAADVPEKLVHLSQSHFEINKLVDELDWPVKMLQAVAEATEGTLESTDRLQSVGKKRKVDEVTLDEVENMTKKINLGPSPEIMSEAGVLEEAFLPDPNQSNEHLNGDEPQKEDDAHLAKAVKNDNSAV